MKKKYALSFLVVLVPIVFNSCVKQALMPNVNQRLSAVIGDADFMNWAKANSGRWLPYSIRKTENNKTNTSPSGILNVWAKNIRPINAAKTYYKSLMQKRTGLADKALDKYLDSVYVRNYKEINQTLKYQATMDSLFASYQRLGNIASSQLNASGIYIPGQYTDEYRKGTGKILHANIKQSVAKKMLSNGGRSTTNIVSDNPDVIGYNTPGCIPVELTDWFDQHYDNVFTDLISQAKLQPFLGDVLFDYRNRIATYLTSGCAQALFENFFWSSVGWVADEHAYIGFSQITCGEATTSIATSLTTYYSCIKEIMPADLIGILADGDPFEAGLVDTYFSDYELDGADMEAIAEVNQQDEEVQTLLSYQCSGAPSMAGNIWFNGIREHWLIQLHYLATHPLAEQEYWIPESSANNPLNTGRADIANPSTGEIFEIKPSDNQSTLNAGIAEVATYVAKANQYCKSSLLGLPAWILGTNFTTVVLPFSATEDIEAKLIQPGLIGYQKVAATPPSIVYIPQTIAEKFKSLIQRLKAYQNFNNVATVERIIMEFLRDPNNTDMLIYLRTAAVGAGLGIIVGTIIEGFLSAGAGIGDDLPCFVMAYKIVRLAFALG